MNQITAPVICIDIDGVVSTADTALPGAIQTFKLIRRDLRDLDPIKYQKCKVGQKLPMMFVTNSGGCIEKLKANTMNNRLQLVGDEQVSATNMILNFTPLRNEMKKYQDKIVLISGTEDYIGISVDCGMNKYITFNEYGRMYPQLVPTIHFPMEETIETRIRVMERLGMQNHKDFEEPLQVHAIFYLYDCINLELVFQITMDLVSTTNGIIAQTLPDNAPTEHIPVFSVVNDALFPSSFRMLRMGFGMYLDSLKDIYRKLYKSEMAIVSCGKPSKLTFQYAQDHGIALCSETGVNVSQFYMIGDNPLTDIRGAKAQGWFTILVRTGVYKDADQFELSTRPDIIVDDFNAAIQFIFQRENIMQ